MTNPTRRITAPLSSEGTTTMPTSSTTATPSLLAYPAAHLWHPNPYLDPTTWPTVPEHITTTCDNTSVGVIIRDDDYRVLMLTRSTAPVGIAPVAGHIDTHNRVIDAAITEVDKATGLTVTGITPTRSNWWRTNICHRQHGPAGPGHTWTLLHATTTGTLNPYPAEATNLRWYTTQEIQALAERTVAYACGYLTPTQFTANPGLEPVWVDFLYDDNEINIPAHYRAAVNHLASWSPHHTGGPR